MSKFTEEYILRNQRNFAFTCQDIVVKFYELAGFKFEPTVPGQLLARSGLKKMGMHTSSRKAIYNGVHWTNLWFEMFALANTRYAYDKSLTKPKFVSIELISSSCPEYKRNEIRADNLSKGNKVIVQANEYEAMDGYQNEMDNFIRGLKNI